MLNKPSSFHELMYNSDFYLNQMDGSYRSAIKYLDFFSNIFKPNSVVDVGCGRGTWLAASGKFGAKRLVGLDGDWNSQELMVDSTILFKKIDLDRIQEESLGEKFDLAISLEVAEHLQPSTAVNFINAITLMSDVVIFGAAYTGQGGTNHINERPHTYWANIFSEFGYVVYDIFRPIFWGDPDVEFWYQQNTFLYVKKESKLIEILNSFNFRPMQNCDFMNCIHPKLYETKLSRQTPTFEDVIGDINYLIHLDVSNVNSIVDFIAVQSPDGLNKITNFLLSKNSKPISLLFEFIKNRLLKCAGF